MRKLAIKTPNGVEYHEVMKKHLSVSKKAIIASRYIVLLLLSIFFLFPLFAMFFKSFMTDTDVLSLPVLFFPTEWTLEGYIQAINPKLLQYAGNTLIVIVVNIIGVPLSAALCAYGFARLKFKGRDACFAIVLSTIMLPGLVVQIPLYVIYYKLNWLNTLYPLIIPGFFGGGAINIFLTRQFMKAIPKDLEEAAKIDGARTIHIFFKLIVPLCLPIITFMAVQTFIGVWNDFMGPLLYLYEENLYTLAIGIYKTYLGANVGTYLSNVQMAVGVIMFIPPLIIFAFFQRQLIDGIVMSGIKG